MIDPVLDYDHRSGKVSTAGADQVLAAEPAQALEVAWILETHANADHLSAAHYIKAHTGALVVIGEHIRDVQAIFRPVFYLDDVSGNGGEFARLRFLPHRRCGVRGRRLVHAGLRHRARRLPRWQRPHLVPVDPEAARAATRHAVVHVPRLQDTWPRKLRVGEHGHRGACAQRARPRQGGRGYIRGHARAPGRDAGRANDAAAVDPGQHPRRPLVQARIQRCALPQDPDASARMAAGSISAAQWLHTTAPLWRLPQAFYFL